MPHQSGSIKRFILKHITKHPVDIVATTAERFHVTRTTVHRHLSSLVRGKQIVKSGMTKDVRYYLSSTFNRTVYYNIAPDLSEDVALRTGFEDILKALSKNNKDIFTYGFTEIFNNAIDHSQGRKIVVSTVCTGDCLKLSIADDGIGIFKNIILCLNRWKYYRIRQNPRKSF